MPTPPTSRPPRDDAEQTGDSTWRTTAGWVAGTGAALGIVVALLAPSILEWVGFPKLVRASWLEAPDKPRPAPKETPELGDSIIEQKPRSDGPAPREEPAPENESDDRPGSEKTTSSPAERRSAEPRREKPRKPEKNKRVRSFTVDGPALQTKITNPQDLLLHGRFVPHEVDGKRRGFRFVEIVDGGLYDKLGMREGDVALSVNGRPLTTQAKLIEDARALKKKSEYLLVLERDGKRWTHRYVMRPPFRVKDTAKASKDGRRGSATE